MSTINKKGSVRSELAVFTRQIHTDLHSHKWISKLAKPNIHEQDYYLLLCAYYHFYNLVEHQRLAIGVHDKLSIAPSVLALSNDCQEHLLIKSRTPKLALVLPDSQSLLGALYVLHGAGFGASLMYRNIQQCLPHAKIHFLSQHGQKDTWRVLCQTLETLGSTPNSLLTMQLAASETFTCFGQFVSAFCESNHVHEGA